MIKYILITGCGGFIGFHVAKYFLKNEKNKVIGVDNLNNYYDVKLKADRIKQLKLIGKKNFVFYKKDLRDQKTLSTIFRENKIEYLFHFAAQAGVRHSLKNPIDYIDNNILVFLNILEEVKFKKLKRIIYASTSSVYGESNDYPLKENSNTNKPIQFYAVSKKTNELMAQAYSKLYNLNLTGLRFFTIYGPWGRPDMALFKFTKNILNKRPIDLYNYGKHSRNFTYIDDAVKMINKLYKKKQTSGHQIFNVANPKNINLIDYVKKIEKSLKIKSIQKKFPLQKGDIEKVSADVKKLKKITNIKKFTSVDTGISQFINWYKDYYNVK